jgi:hypothetical protein
MVNIDGKYDIEPMDHQMVLMKVGDKVLFIVDKGFETGTVIKILPKHIKIEWFHHTFAETGHKKTFTRHSFNTIILK